MNTIGHYICAKAIVERDRAVTSPFYTRDYPLVVARGQGCMVEDMDGNVFLDMTAGIAAIAAYAENIIIGLS